MSPVDTSFENDGFAFMFYRDTHQGHVTQNVTISVTDHDKDPPHFLRMHWFVCLTVLLPIRNENSTARMAAWCVRS